MSVPVWASAGTWWSDHHGRTRRDDQHVVSAAATDHLRVSVSGRDIGVDSLTTQLVINRCSAHRAHTVEAGLRGRQHRGVYRLWVDARLCVQAVDGSQQRANPTDPPEPISGARTPERRPRNPLPYLVVTRRRKTHSSGIRLSRMGCHGRFHRHRVKSTAAQWATPHWRRERLFWETAGQFVRTVGRSASLPTGACWASDDSATTRSAPRKPSPPWAVLCWSSAGRLSRCGAVIRW
jgi:hypothetical protein